MKNRPFNTTDSAFLSIGYADGIVSIRSFRHFIYSIHKLWNSSECQNSDRVSCEYIADLLAIHLIWNTNAA